MSRSGAGAPRVVEGGEGDLHVQPARGRQQVAGPGRVADGHRHRADPEPAGGGQGRAGGRAGAEDQHRCARRAGTAAGHPCLGERGDHARARRCCDRAAARRSKITVLAAPTSAASGSISVEQRQHGALERHRQRQPGPVRARSAASRPGRPCLVALDRLVRPAGQAERLVGGPVQDRRQGMRDR